MPRYHFHVFDGHDVVDTVGTELPDLNAAKREAVRYAGSLLQEHVGDLWTGGAWKMMVTDHRGVSLFILMFLGMETTTQLAGSAPVTSND